MSNSPRSRDPSLQGPRAFWLVLLSRPVLGVLLVLGLLLGAAAWRGLIFIERELAPMVEGNLLKLLSRPVKLGPLKRFSLNEIEFGRSTVPPHERTVSGKKVLDRDQASTESVLVRFNPWTAVINRTLELDVTLNKPTAYIDKDPDGQWIGTRLTPQPESGGLKIKLKALRAKNGTVTLAPLTHPKRVLQGLNGAALFTQDNQKIDFHGTTGVDSGGRVALNGTWKQPQQQLLLTTRSQELTLAPLAGFLPPNPLRLKSGTYDGRVQLDYRPKQPLQIVSKGTLANADIQWPNPLVFAKARRVEMDVAATLPPNQQPFLKGKADIQGGEGKVPEKLVLSNGRNRLQTARKIAGTVLFLGASRRMQLDLRGALAIGGKIRTKGEVLLPLEEAKLLVQAQDVPASLLDRAYQLPINIRSGKVGGNLTVQLKKDQRPYLQGIASLKGVDAAVKGVPQPFLDASGYVRFKGLTATLDRVKTRYGSIPLIANGSIDPDRGYDLVADTGAVEVNRALKTLKVGTLPFPLAGQVKASNIRVRGEIPRPVLTGQVQTVGPATVDRIPMRTATAQFNLVPSLLTVSAIAAQPMDGGTVTGRAALQIPAQGDRFLLNAQFQAAQLSGDAIARLYNASPGFALGLVSGTALVSGPLKDIQTAVQFQAPKAAYPARGRVLVRGGKATLQDVVARIKGGELHLDGVVTDKQVQLNAVFPGLALTAYSPDLKGALSGRLAIHGPLAGFSAKTARAQGSVRFSKGLSLIQDPITAQIQWNGRQILVDRASAPNFVARGTVGASLEGPAGPQLTTLNLNVLANNYKLNRLSALGLPQNPLHGQADLRGTLGGTLAAPTLNSALKVRDLKVSDVAFESFLAGNLKFNMARGLQLNLGGDRDRINVALDAQQLPVALDIRRDKATIVGRRNGPNTFAAVFTDVPISALNGSLNLSQKIGAVSGLASGSVNMNLKTRDTVGSFAVAQPGLGRFLGDRLTGKVRYAKGVGTLSEALLVQGENKYLLDATLVNGPDPKVSGRLVIAQSQLENLIAFGQSFRLPVAQNSSSGNLGRAADVQTAAVNLAEVPLWQQLQRLAEVDQFLAQQKAKQSANGTIPDWQKLKGRIAGAVQFSGSAKTGLKGSFDLNAQNLDLDPYRFEQAIAKGQWTPTGLTVEPLTISQGESSASFAGHLGGPNQSGQLTVTKVPLDSIADILNMPVNAVGKINGTANLSGRWDNPKVQGQFDVAEGIVNRAKIQQATTQFDYDNARLAFNALATIGSPEPITIKGTVPYALPFSAVKPKSNQVDIAMSVKDQGLALANLFTDQVAWVDGKGQLKLQVKGTVDRPLMKGALAFQDATLRSPSLTEPLTQVNTSIRFDSDRLTVESLTGRYNQSQLTAAGSLPIFDNTLQLSNPLSVNLNNTAFNLKGLYRGQASGSLNVTGSALQPTIGGVIALQNGQVLLSSATALSPTGTSQAQANAGNPLEFKNLQVRLGQNIRLLQPPVLSFIASGQVNLNGSIDAPRPDGTVSFEKGQVNLFTTQFRIDQRRKNFAKFTPTYGLDPYLNLSLRTTVTDVISGRKTDLNEFKDIQPGTLGSIESVKVRATIQGRASQLGTRFNDVLELSSTPNRSQNEILALLSGGVSQSLESGNAQGALVNLASSAFLNRVQSVVDDVLGSRVNFRLFPLLTPTKNNTSTVLELGAELGLDVTDKLSVSLLQVVTSTNDSPQFNVNYDINNQFRARGSVNLQGDAVGILEYRLRF
jgi:translocation and assembly module TamB